MSYVGQSTAGSSPAPGQGARRQKIRYLKDIATRYTVGFGGVSVIFAIVLIFFYLLYVVFPLFVPADMQRQSSYQVPGVTGEQTLYLSIEEQNEVGLRATDAGRLVFFNVNDGSVLKQVKLAAPGRVSSFAAGILARHNLIFGFSNGTAMVVRHNYGITYPEDKKHIEPGIGYPLGDKPIVVDPRHKALSRIAFRQGEDRSTVLSQTADGRLLLVSLTKEESGQSLDEEAPARLQVSRMTLPAIVGVDRLLIDPEQHTAYIVEQSGYTTSINISDPVSPHLIERVPLASDGVRVTSIEFLTGGISLLVGGSDGSISQWFPVNRDGQPRLTRIRSFDTGDEPIAALATEQRRKGFVAADVSGNVSIHHSTSRRTLISEPVSGKAIGHIAISPRADTLIAEDAAGVMQLWHITNEHPEVSWSVLWNKVWYESYDKPDYTWQSSSASNDFEPKFSLVPLAFGTLKAAFYAMLFAVPLAILGAIYTAYFMAPAMRTYVKPTIEIMEALPTVILGFLAGLWLAPFIENKLPAIFSLLVLLPVGTLAFSFAWYRLPRRYTAVIPEGWQAALLVPVLILIGAFALAMSAPLESWLFHGDMRTWLGTELGLAYDQRNSIVVGIAMGVAVIPTIFSIAEDAIFSVPRHLTFGSLALGATLWQTLTRVVILTASPGIFSAIMIGLGRAVGETMIVLMATGNTPVMDLSIFQGMRTLSANIAVEMPESEVNSTHFRVLFLAALVLFMFTFFFNTAAEIVRQRLRQRYSSL